MHPGADQQFLRLGCPASSPRVSAHVHRVHRGQSAICGCPVRVFFLLERFWSAVAPASASVQFTGILLMNDMSSTPGSASATAHRAFPAFRYRGFQIQFTTYVLAMMADNIEHVISYWMLYQKFHSPALAGFAVLSHWLPFLMFSVAAGALADRFDPRRLIQCGMGLFILASLGWGYFFVTGTLEVWHAMVLLVIHGCAGVLWQTPNQLLLYDIVGPADLMSAVGLNATARYVGVLGGAAVGGAILLARGPAHGILLNTVFYLPLVLWLVKAPYGPRFRGGAPPPRRAG